ncbi:ABC transporter ATP-binding protein YtrB [Koleobacter methoxysyntrophicus]|uniref:ABC transporter ATP-binding protein YtrB n=1 Tax=Koleobacter methoxysyntrophicus TaxID=2751313 RepID=A0A8A0RLF2_9FIRM|nr:ABC transporter ATP-binding protein [Koleobacter methoxysyntrophicus]QSQ08722.1 ABC transporter ATP-binding protein YtrB [Koleobacter methoxysyntrophicus]
MEKILEVKNLRKEYSDFILNDISFSLEKGYIMGFIGPNGAGKSTTIKLIMNLAKRDAGEIKIFGLDNINDEVVIKQKIGFVYDQNYFYGDLTIAEIKRIIAPFYVNWNDRIFNKYIKEFELPADRKIKHLSRGMQMKFSLALALSHDADLIILDEPTSGLDPVFRNGILDILADLIQDENKGVLFSTHITGDLDKIADYITFINKGEIVFSMAKDDILDNYAIVKGPRELLDDGIKKEFTGMRFNRFGFEGLISDRNRTKKLFKDRVIVERATLEDIMLFSVRGNGND